MDLVVSDPELEGLGAMLAGLVRGNIEADPARAGLIRGVTGTVNVRARDAGVAVGLAFEGGRLRVQDRPFPRAQLEIACDAETLMGMSTVPLRFGLPDVAAPDGRAVLGKMLRGDLRVRGMLLHLPLLIRLQRLLAVS